MALSLNYPDQTCDTFENAYVVISPNLNNFNKTGFLEIRVWKSKKNRKDNKNPINYYSIQIGLTEILNNDTTINILSYDDIAWKTGEQVYKKIKTLKIKVENNIIDFSMALDV